MIVRTEAVVLKAMKFRESSKILTLYTRQFGKVSVIAKGARDRKGRFGSALEPMSHVVAVFYKKDRGGLYLLSQCDLMKSHRRLTEDMETMAAAMAMIELVNAVSHEEESNEQLFELLTRSLDTINDVGKNTTSVVFGFEVRLSENLGFRPNLHSCSHCGRAVHGHAGGPQNIEMNIGTGGVLCTQCSRSVTGGSAISLTALKVLQRLQDMRDIEAATRLSMPPRVREEIGTMLRRYLQNHVSGLDHLKSETVFAAIL